MILLISFKNYIYIFSSEYTLPSNFSKCMFHKLFQWETGFRTKKGLLHDLVSFTCHTFCPMFSNFFDFLHKMRFVKVIKIRSRYFSTEPFFEVWKQIIVTGSQIQWISRMRKQFIDQFINFLPNDSSNVHLCIVLVKNFLLVLICSSCL